MATLQLQLCLEQPIARPLNLVGMVREALVTHEWLTPYEVQHWVSTRYGEWHSDASITARLRDLRKSPYGAHVILRRKREGTKSFEYRMEA